KRTTLRATCRAAGLVIRARTLPGSKLRMSETNWNGRSCTAAQVSCAAGGTGSREYVHRAIASTAAASQTKACRRGSPPRRRSLRATNGTNARTARPQPTRTATNAGMTKELIPAILRLRPGQPERTAVPQLRQARLLIRDRRSADADGLAAVDDEGVTDGESAEVRAQPQGRRGDLLGSAHATDRFLGDDAGTALGGASGEATHHRGLDDARADRVDADPLGRDLQRRGLRHSDDPVLGGGIGGLTADAHDTG